MRHRITIIAVAALITVMMSLSAGTAWALKSPKNQGDGGFQSPNPHLQEQSIETSKKHKEEANCGESVGNSGGNSNCGHHK